MDPVAYLFTASVLVESGEGGQAGYLIVAAGGADAERKAFELANAEGVTGRYRHVYLTVVEPLYLRDAEFGEPSDDEARMRFFHRSVLLTLARSAGVDLTFYRPDPIPLTYTVW